MFRKPIAAVYLSIILQSLLARVERDGNNQPTRRKTRHKTIDPDSLAASAEVQAVMLRLYRFYQKYNPAKLENRQQIARKYVTEGKVEALFNELVYKYGPEP